LSWDIRASSEKKGATTQKKKHNPITPVDDTFAFLKKEKTPNLSGATAPNKPENIQKRSKKYPRQHPQKDQSYSKCKRNQSNPIKQALFPHHLFHPLPHIVLFAHFFYHQIFIRVRQSFSERVTLSSENQTLLPKTDKQKQITRRVGPNEKRHCCWGGKKSN
jgi:hypothetical protein